MFDRRLGLALGKSEGEIRALPYPEWRRWQLHYLVEPWGWENQEYLMASVVAMIHNINQDKRSKMKNQKEFMRDMQNARLEALHRQAEIDYINSLSINERKEYLLPIIKKDFGII